MIRFAFVTVTMLFWAVPLAAQSDTGVELRVTPDVLAVGDTVTITLVNNSDREFVHGFFCGIGMQRRADAGWERASPTPVPIACALAGLRMVPGESAEHRMTILPHLQPGTYRFREEFPLRDPNEWIEVFSNPFEIEQE